MANSLGAAALSICYAVQQAKLRRSEAHAAQLEEQLNQQQQLQAKLSARQLSQVPPNSRAQFAEPLKPLCCTRRLETSSQCLFLYYTTASYAMLRSGTI